MSSLLSEEAVRVDKLIASPWPYLVVDDFLDTDCLARCLSEIRSDTYAFDIEPRGTGRIEYSVLKSQAMWRAIYSKRTRSILSEAFGVGVRLNQHNMLQLRRMNEETPEFPMHNDFTSDEATIASFLYLSEGWFDRCGGRLHLFASDKQSIPSASIAPIQNRFIAFRTEASHWHSVEKVCGWERISVLSLWNIERL
jgi:hypothetical protein